MRHRTAVHMCKSRTCHALRLSKHTLPSSCIATALARLRHAQQLELVIRGKNLAFAILNTPAGCLRKNRWSPLNSVLHSTALMLKAKGVFMG